MRTKTDDPAHHGAFGGGSHTSSGGGGSSSSSSSPGKPEGCLGVADQRRVQGTCLESLSTKTMNTTGMSFRVRNRCSERIVFDYAIRRTTGKPDGGQTGIRAGATTSIWTYENAGGGFDYTAWFSVNGSQDWTCRE